jgi:hypothetical protein
MLRRPLHLASNLSGAIMFYLLIQELSKRLGQYLDNYKPKVAPLPPAHPSDFEIGLARAKDRLAKAQLHER